MFRNFLMAGTVFLGICFARPHSTPPALPASQPFVYPPPPPGPGGPPAPPVFPVSPSAPKCDCGCVEGKECKCGLKCPDVLKRPAVVNGWHNDYELALAESQATNKPLFVDVHTTNCVWCDRLESQLSQVDLSGYVKCKLYTTEYQAQLLGVTAYPTLLVIQDGQYTARHVGFATADVLRSVLRPVAQAVAHPVQTIRNVVTTIPFQVFSNGQGGNCRSGR